VTSALEGVGGQHHASVTLTPGAERIEQRTYGRMDRHGEALCFMQIERRTDGRTEMAKLRVAFAILRTRLKTAASLYGFVKIVARDVTLAK
jgi:hypothetical protein